jgi:hypothetical protein
MSARTLTLQAKIRQLGHELALAEASGGYCSDWVSKKKEHDGLLERLYKLEKRIFA